MIFKDRRKEAEADHLKRKRSWSTPSRQRKTSSCSSENLLSKTIWKRIHLVRTLSFQPVNTRRKPKLSLVEIKKILIKFFPMTKTTKNSRHKSQLKNDTLRKAGSKLNKWKKKLSQRKSSRIWASFLACLNLKSWKSLRSKDSKFRRSRMKINCLVNLLMSSQRSLNNSMRLKRSLFLRKPRSRLKSQ